jgi:hypothetical protein
MIARLSRKNLEFACSVVIKVREEWDECINMNNSFFCSGLFSRLCYRCTWRMHPTKRVTIQSSDE